MTTYPLNLRRLRIVHPIPVEIDAIETIRAHSRNSNTPIARQTATPERTKSENPPAIAIPTIATETGSPAFPPVIPIKATKKKANEPRTSIVAPKNVRIAIIVTPMGRFTFYLTSTVYLVRGAKMSYTAHQHRKDPVDQWPNRVPDGIDSVPEHFLNWSFSVHISDKLRGRQ